LADSWLSTMSAFPGAQGFIDPTVRVIGRLG
jgi:hypothetical protein